MKAHQGPVVKTIEGQYKLVIGKNERQVLTSLISQLREMLTRSTEDPALRRLFPVAYHNDPPKDAEYQRLMREELLTSRLVSTQTAIEVISSKDSLSENEIDAFVRSINSVRILLGTILDVSETPENPPLVDQKSNPADQQDDDSAEGTSSQRELYEYLGWLIEWSIQAQQQSN